VNIAPPIACLWDGEAFVPRGRFAAVADRHYVVGEVYPMIVQEDRSSVSHRHYFACINEVFKNLPDEMAVQFATAEHLRKWALVSTGWYEERRLVLSTSAEARKVAAFLRTDDYAVISVAGCVVIERKAKSQSMRAMPKGGFQKSKTDVLDFLSNLIGVTTETLASNAERAA
jgi:hypothetical protein